MDERRDFEAARMPAGAARLPAGHRRALTVALGVVLGWTAFNLFYSLGDHPLYSPSEARYARVSQVMLERGDWLVPRFEGEPRLAKPPLVHWAQCAAMALVGRDALGARLPSALAMLGVGAAAWWLMRRMRDGLTGLLAATLAMGLPLSLAIGRIALTDALLAAWWAWAVALAHAGWGGRRRVAGAAAARAGFWAMIALALLTKGPAGLIPMLIVWAWLACRGRWRALADWRWAAGLAAAAMPLGLWAAAAAARHPEAWAVWREQVLARASGAGDHPRPWWYYLPIVAAGLFPATAMLPLPGVHVGWRRAWRATAAGHPLGYLAIAAAVPVVAYSLMVGKLWTYMLPVAMPVACMAAWGLRGWLEATDDAAAIGRGHRARRLPNGTGSIAAATTLGLVALAVAAAWPRSRAAIGLNRPFDAVLLKLALQAMVVPAMLWASWALWRRGRWRPWAIALLGGALATAGVTASTVEDAVMRPRGVPAMIAAVREAIGEGPIVFSTVGDRDPSLSFYLDEEVRRVEEMDADAAPAADARWVVVGYDGGWAKLASARPAFAARFEPLFTWTRALDELDVRVARPAAADARPGQP